MLEVKRNAKLNEHPKPRATPLTKKQLRTQILDHARDAQKIRGRNNHKMMENNQQRQRHAISSFKWFMTISSQTVKITNKLSEAS